MSSNYFPNRGRPISDHVHRQYQRLPASVRFVDEDITAGQPKSILRPPPSTNAFGPSRRDQPKQSSGPYYRGPVHGSMMHHDRQDGGQPKLDNVDLGLRNYREHARHGQTGQRQTAVPEPEVQPDVEVVDVPEHHVFFTLRVAIRQSTLDKLNLDSLFKYIDYLDEYRQEKRDSIVQFNKSFYSMLKDKKMGDSNKDLEDKDFVNCQEKTTAEVSLQIESIEKRLQACQGNRVAGTRFESCLVVPVKSDEDSLEETEDLSLPIGKIDDTKVDKNDQVEVIDLTYRKELDQIKADLASEILQAEKPMQEQGEQDLAKEELNDSAITTDAKKRSFSIANDSVIELQAKLSEMQFAAVQKQTIKPSPIPLMDFSMKDLDGMLATNKAISANQMPSFTPDAVAPSSSGIKLNINGHQLPLPKEFIQLSSVQKNAILRQLPELIRGQFLGMVWQARFYEHLAKTSNDVTELTFNL